MKNDKQISDIQSIIKEVYNIEDWTTSPENEIRIVYYSRFEWLLYKLFKIKPKRKYR